MRAAERHYMQSREGPRVASDGQAMLYALTFALQKGFEENNRKIAKNNIINKLRNFFKLKEFCVLHVQSNTTIFYLLVQ